VSPFRFVRVLALAGVVAGSAAMLGATSVFAYGHADQPVAQLEISGNCNNPDFDFCKNVVGLGGIWLWIEIDANGTADVAGAGCGHILGGPRGGAESIRGEFDWIEQTIPPNPQLLVTDPANTYYVLPDLNLFPIPTTQGHYSWHPVNGVALEIQVAP
jgi:hypothetical protein